jgi:hypothetical protein
VRSHSAVLALAWVPVAPTRAVSSNETHLLNVARPSCLRPSRPMPAPCNMQRSLDGAVMGRWRNARRVAPGWGGLGTRQGSGIRVYVRGLEFGPSGELADGIRKPVLLLLSRRGVGMMGAVWRGSSGGVRDPGWERRAGRQTERERQADRQTDRGVQSRNLLDRL